jgi:hypothetical protein
MRQMMEQARQQMTDRMRQDLGATEDEWKLLQPMIEKVQMGQRLLRSSGMGSTSRPGGPGDRPSSDRPRSDRSEGDRAQDDRARSDRPPSDRPPSDRPPSDRPQSDRPPSDRPASDRPPSDRPQSDVEKKAEALRKLLQNKEATPEEIKAAMTALREARTQLKTEVEAAQKDLREVVTVRQEAQLVLMGILD